MRTTICWDCAIIVNMMLCAQIDMLVEFLIKNKVSGIDSSC